MVMRGWMGSSFYNLKKNGIRLKLEHTVLVVSWQLLVSEKHAPILFCFDALFDFDSPIYTIFIRLKHVGTACLSSSLVFSAAYPSWLPLTQVGTKNIQVQQQKQRSLAKTAPQLGFQLAPPTPTTPTLLNPPTLVLRLKRESLGHLASVTASLTGETVIS